MVDRFQEFILIGPDGTRYALKKLEEPKILTPSQSKFESLGQRIRKLRKAKGWSQSELGRMAGGITQATISRIENEDTEDPQPNTISTLLDALKR